MLVGAHPPGLLGVDARRERSQRVRALDRAPHAALGDDLEDARLGQQRDVAVQTARRHVVELGGELAGRQRAVAEEGLDDSQPDRVQEEIGAGHGRVA